MKDHLLRFLLPILILGILVGCSGGDNPVSPIPVGNGNGISPHRNLPSAGNHFLWLYDMIRVDPSNPDAVQVEMIPLRDVAAHWNVLGFLEQWPCRDCLKITNIVVSGDGTLLVDVRITHPFTGANFTGFDVRGIAMFDGSRTFPVADLSTPDRTLGDGELVNADGYTTLYNPATIGSGPGGLQGYLEGRLSSATPPSATLNGYKRHITDDPSNTRNAFYAGYAVTETYEIDMPDGPFIFGYAVDACWSQAINRPVTNPMNDFGPDANCEEPWKIEVTETPIGAGLTACGGRTVLNIDVYDRQGRDSHDLPFVECPELFAGAVNAEWTVDGDGYSSYMVTVSNDELAPAGSYECLVSVEDFANDPVGKPWLDLTAYQVIPLEVAEFTNLPPVAIAEASTTSAFIGELIVFDGSASFDADCDGNEIVKWEWDWENDGTYDDEGRLCPTVWYTEGLYEVQLRVTDDEGSTDTLDEPLLIEITEEGGWAKVWGDGANWANEIASDAEGNVYVAGLAPDGASLRKVAPDSTELWARVWGSGGLVLCDAVAVDAVSGSVYVTGFFGAGCDFDPGPGEDFHEPLGGSDIFLSKFTLDGDFVWARTWGGESSGGSFWFERGHGVAVDSSGNVYACGIYKGTCDFDPGLGEEIHTSVGGEDAGFDAYLSKFNSDGDFQWVRVWGTANPAADTGDIAFAVTCGKNDDVYAVGGFLGTVDFDPGPGTDERTSVTEYGDYYLLKWSLDGDYIWVRTWPAMGMSDFPGTSQCWGGSYVTTDAAGDIYCVGAFDSAVDFNPGPGDAVRTGPGGFLSKFDTSGDFIWVDAWQQPGLADNNPYAVAVDPVGDIYVCGFFTEEMDMDPGPGEDLKQPPGERAAWLCKMNSSNSYQWSLVWGPTTAFPDMADGWSVTTDPDSNVYAAGLIRGVADFDPGPGVEEHDGGGWGAYLVKYTPDGTW